MQFPVFRELGLDLSRYRLATINVSVEPLVPTPRYERSWKTFRQVAWHPEEPAEDFSFFSVAIRRSAAPGGWVPGLIYHPHPETKPAHFQPPHLLEVLAEEWIPDLAYEDAVELALDPNQWNLELAR